MLTLLILIISGVLIYINFHKIEDFFLSAPRDLLWLSMIMLGFIGASSVIVPIPYTGIVFIISSIPNVNILEIAIFVGIGSALGEITGWFLGYAVHGLVPRTYHNRIRAFLKFVKAKGIWAVYLLLFIFALTPLPDDAIFIALGMIRFSLIKALIPCIAGKILALYLIATAGKIFGTTLEETIGITGTIVMTLVIIIAFMLSLIHI